MKEYSYLTPTIHVKVPLEVYCKIRDLCSKIPNLEWSGIVFYTIEYNNASPVPSEIILEDILIMDIGSKNNTEFNIDERLIDFMNENTIRYYWQIGSIHSHHNMPVSFSIKDIEDLLKNSNNHNYYFSMIVNNNMDMIAKVAQKSFLKTLKHHIVKGIYGKEYTISTSSETIENKTLMYHCLIECPIDKIDNQIDQILNQKK